MISHIGSSYGQGGGNLKVKSEPRNGSTRHNRKRTATRGTAPLVTTGTRNVDGTIHRVNVHPIGQSGLEQVALLKLRDLLAVYQQSTDASRLAHVGFFPHVVVRFDPPAINQMDGPGGVPREGIAHIIDATPSLASGEQAIKALRHRNSIALFAVMPYTQLSDITR